MYVKVWHVADPQKVGLSVLRRQTASPRGSLCPPWRERPEHMTRVQKPGDAEPWARTPGFCFRLALQRHHGLVLAHRPGPTFSRVECA